jgi:hypothetical protein
LPRLLLGVGAYFDFVGASERLSCTGTARRKRMSDVRGLSDMSNQLFVTVIT